MSAHLPAASWTLWACGGIGILLGLLSGLLTKALYILEDAFERLPVHWMWWPALGGLAVGLGGLIEPRVLGVGYDVIHDLLSGGLVMRVVLVIFAVKAVIWLIALSSGTSGGVLAPLLIIGGAAGWLCGLVLPGPAAGWALIGMAAMLGGTMRAPLTGAVFALELTGDLPMLPGLLAATAAAYAVTVLLMKRSILTEKIARRGQHITREYGVDPHQVTRVAEVMIRDVDVLPAALPVNEAIEALERGERRVYPVVDAAGRPVGLVSRGDAMRWRRDSRAGEEIGRDRLEDRISDAALAVAHPDDVTARVIDLMVASGQGRVPVTDLKTGTLVGLVTRKNLLQVRAGEIRNEEDRQAYFRASPRRGEPA
jgi:CBS domain-containing protein